MKTINLVLNKFNLLLILFTFLILPNLQAQQEYPIIRKTNISLNSNLFDKENLSFPLFNNTQIKASQLFVDEHPNGAVCWVGHIDGEKMGSVIIASLGGAFWGKIETDAGEMYLIRSIDGALELQQLDYNPIDEDCSQIENLDEKTEKDHLHNNPKSNLADNICLAGSTCSAQVLDIIVVYTAAARTNLGGVAAAQSAIAMAISEINLINSNSNVTHSFALVHTEEVSYVETGDFATDLDRLQIADDGFIDEIHDLRDEYYADAVSMVLSTGGCGRAKLNTNSDQYDAQRAFSVVSNSCLTTNKSLAHEVGHNLGFRHDRYTYGGTLPSVSCDWGWGWVNPAAEMGGASERWRTIMAYNEQCSDWGVSCTRVNHWSNPDVDYNSDPTGSTIGNADEANNQYILERAACQFTDFRVAIDCVDCEVYQDCSNYNVNTDDGPGNTTTITIDGPFSSSNGSTDPEICVYYYGDHSGSSEQFDVKDENGNVLGQTVASFDCDIPTRVCFSISSTTYNLWIADASVVITLDPQGTSINPTFCTANRACAELVVYSDASTCPPNYSGVNQLMGTESGIVLYETNGVIESDQTLIPDSQVEYNSQVEVNLLTDFEVILGAIFEAYIEGCPTLSFENEETEDEE